MRCLSALASVGLSLALFAAAAPAGEKGGFKSIFDGETMKGWDGDPKFWSVEGGALTGRTTKENPTRGNTFLVWTGGEPADFELKLKFRIEGGNSGIQFRSKRHKGSKWVISGHQADFDAGGNWTGTLYHEKGRGLLAKRGNNIGKNKGLKPAGKAASEKEILAAVKKGEWNDYYIMAKGRRIVQKVNGVTTIDVIDEGAKNLKGLIALQLHAGPPMKVQFKDIQLKELKAGEGKTSSRGHAEPFQFVVYKKAEAKASGEPLKIVFIAGRDSHGHGAHEHGAGCMLLMDCLKQGMPNVETVYVRGDWPQDESVLKDADAIVIYCDGGRGHLINNDLQAAEKYMKKGVGLACLHYAVEVPKGESGEAFLKWIGGYFETHWSVNPHWVAKFTKLPDHPITRGVKPFEVNDEWYYHMRFREGMKGVTPILTAMPPESTLKRRDGAHSNNPHVRKAVLERKEPQHVAWAATREDGGRGFGFTGGHFHRNWAEPNFRKVALNAIVWIAGGEVPSGGVESKNPTPEQLEAYIKKAKADSGQPARKKKAVGQIKADKAKFASSVVTKRTPGHAVEIDVDITGAKELHLVVTDGGNGYACDWADWAEPRLVGPQGEKKLTELKWTHASADWGQVRVNQNGGGGPLRIAGKSVAYGIGAHANSLISYKLPPGFTRFKARGGLDNGGTDQGNCGESASVRFLVFTEKPAAQVVLAKQRRASGGGGGRDPQEALEALDVHEDLQAELFAAEPMLLSPSNIDIDHKGRVWVCEIVNYRRHKGKRPEGDRILILEDTDGDGRADKKTTFYQGKDIDSPHGVCVLATPSGKGTQVIVSAGDKVQVFTDEDGDLKADKQRTLFSGISGTQHDHGIHAFVFGPDGKLYFNFGNSGRQIKDAQGKPIIDMAGNEVREHRKPYQQGMVFRCNLDGSEFETLGWNFRNNWMATVDSFGTIWQSDNDDDGNRGVRINYVMEFGNYGYRDEITGAGWKTKRTGMHAEIPKRHWHLNDPGVVPNLLQTGAGSPTGITVYEGKLLPEVFQGEVIHTDAGPNVCRAYPVENDGAGYKAETVNVLVGARDKWYRPSDVSVAPDGSLIIADWYDPGVGGHNMRDLERGRLFRVTPKGHQGYKIPKFDFSTAEGAVEALKNPNYAVRYMAWTALHKMGAKAEPALLKMYKGSQDPRLKARALWLLGKIEGRGEHYVEQAISERNSNLRIVGVRLARQLKLDMIPIIRRLVRDESPQVRRELLIALRHSKSSEAPQLWAELAVQHDGQDRWYLEALGIAAARNWDAFFSAWLEKVGGPEKAIATAAGRDIIWRSRSTKAPALLAQIIKRQATSEEEKPRYFRALDFHDGPEKQEALKSLLDF